MRRVSDASGEHRGRAGTRCNARQPGGCSSKLGYDWGESSGCRWRKPVLNHIRTRTGISSWNIGSDQGKRGLHACSSTRVARLQPTARHRFGRGLRRRAEPHVDRSVRPPRSPRLGPGRGVVAERAPEPEVGGGERVALAARPHRDVVGGPGPESGQRLELGDGVVEVAGAVQFEVAAGDGAGQLVDRRARARVSPTSVRSASASVAAAGKRCVRPSARDAPRRACRTARRVVRRAWSRPRPRPAGRAPRARSPRTGRCAPGTRMPRRARTSGRRVRSRASAASITVGSASRSKSRRTLASRCTRPSRSGRWTRRRSADRSGSSHTSMTPGAPPSSTTRR